MKAGHSQSDDLALGSVYSHSCVDHEGLRNPVELWLAADGRYQSRFGGAYPRLCDALRPVPCIS